ncbi:hypothetical protein A2572_00680 [Candidatus Collierbacteria bacterium RIFOXYD1_FULL_40_9]|uniref:CN hydrolase domain-containing protein n=1 Tax=Candidatus Collierbacteria bacterium RIFOXYD1_FULL_40_9 TaxID=1817731 RepID=A0A1F5FWP3_9BACT|nr:MAG: hypothetical protein A2572_00680 [Candidatus Collierbacteria bacterium RIFOXYD1_FULL_40_9]
MYWEKEVRKYKELPEEWYFRDTGVFRANFENGVEITGVSANSWEDYLEHLYRVRSSDKYVVSPELITCAGMNFEDLVKNESLINERIEEVAVLSKKYVDTYFLLGTPLFVNERPRNSVLVIKSGEIVSATNKRHGATDEENGFFEMVPEEVPLLLPQTKVAVVICSDFGLASLYAGCESELVDEVLRVSGKTDLAGKDVCVLPENVESVLLISCWGVGSKYVEEGEQDQYYKNQLMSIAWRIMKGSKVKDVIVVDRVPTNLSEELMKVTPTKPYNGVIRSR